VRDNIVVDEIRSGVGSRTACNNYHAGSQSDAPTALACADWFASSTALSQSAVVESAMTPRRIQAELEQRRLEVGRCIARRIGMVSAKPTYIDSIEEGLDMLDSIKDGLDIPTRVMALSHLVQSGPQAPQVMVILIGSQIGVVRHRTFIPSPLSEQKPALAVSIA